MRELTEQEHAEMINAYGEAVKTFPKGANITDGFEAGFIAGLDYQQAEIERLKKGIDDLTDYYTLTVNELEAEVERLRVALKMVRSLITGDMAYFSESDIAQIDAAIGEQ